MPRIRGPRFRIDVFPRGGDRWEAKVYDHEDHGTDLAYAGVYGSLQSVLLAATHYVIVADAPVLDLASDASRNKQHSEEDR